MKQKRLLSISGATVLSMLVFFAHADDQINSDWMDAAADGILGSYDRESILIIGELHGTEEAPALVATLVQRLAKEGVVTVGLEVPRQEQDRIDEFLRSDGGPCALSELLAGDFWRVEAENSDGRRSQAMVQLLETIRAARALGVPLTVATLDDVEFHTKDRDRHQGIADRIVELGKELVHEPVVVLVGNYHARLAPLSGPETAVGEDMEELPVPTAARITGVPLTSVNVTASSGKFWACRGAGSCGPIELTGKRQEVEEVQVVEPDEVPTVYNLHIVLKKFTPSPPAR